MNKYDLKHKRSQGTLDYCIKFATIAHQGQKRKYLDDVDYIVHPIEVAKYIMDHTMDIDMICASILHDVIEDCGVTYEGIRDKFGIRCARMVLELTQFSILEDGNREFRKMLDARYLEKASVQAKSIKCADLIHNSKSIIEFGGDFTEVYMPECKDLLLVLEDASIPFLHDQLETIVFDYFGIKKV